MNINDLEFVKENKLSELGAEEIIQSEFNYFSTQAYHHLAKCATELWLHLPCVLLQAGFYNPFVTHTHKSKLIGCQAWQYVVILNPLKTSSYFFSPTSVAFMVESWW